MTASNKPAAKGTVIGAIVLAFRHSNVGDVVGTDALRSVLEVEYSEMCRDGTFDLQPLWELLEDQPGLDTQAALPPLCRFQSWHEQLGLEVRLPKALEQLGARERAYHADQCKVPIVDFKLLFKMSSPQSATEARSTQRMSAMRSTQRVPVVASSPSGGSSRRRQWAVVAGAIGGLCLVFSAITIYSECSRTAAWETRSINAAFAGDLPVAKPRRLGEQVTAVLSDPAWLQVAEDTRKKQLRDALDRLQPDGIRVLIVLDDENQVRATAQYFKGTLSFTFR